MKRELEINKIYRHFKGGLYFVHNVVLCSESKKDLVLYQAMYEPYNTYVRPFNMFLEKVEEGRKDNITNQIYRFEIYK